MIAKLRAFMATEVFKYLFFGVLATLVYMVSRTLALAYFLVDTYPEIIGQFVGHSHAWVNGIESLFSQVLIIVLNYIISKFFVFTGEKV